MVDETLVEVRGLRTDVQMLTRGLMNLNDGIGNLDTAVQNLVDASTEEPGDDNPTAEALRGLAAAVNANTAQLSRLREAITGAMLRGGGALSEG